MALSLNSSSLDADLAKSPDRFAKFDELILPATDTSSASRRSFEAAQPETEGSPSQSWRSLFAFTTTSHAPTICIGLITTCVAALTKPTGTIFLGLIFGNLTRFGAGSINSQELLSEVSKWCIALTALGGAAWFLEGIFLGSWLIFGELQAQCARDRLFNGLLGKDMVWFDLREDGTASLLTRIQTQIRELQLGISQPMGFLVYELFDASAAIGIAIYFSWQLSLVILATMPIVIMVLYLITSRLGPAVEAQKRHLSQASKHVSNSITAINTVKYYNGEDYEVWQYLTTMKLVARSYMIQARINAMQFGVIKFVMVGLFVQGFWFGLFLLDHNEADPAHIVTAFYACLNAIQSIEVILPQWLVLAKAISAGGTLKMILSKIQEGLTVDDTDGRTIPKQCDGDIEISNVTFSYPSNLEQNVLKNANFFFPASEMTFVVGLSGSGKSTLGNLLLKYYEPASGELLVGGIPLKTLNTNWVRENIHLVQQETILFAESIGQNIAFGRHDVVARTEVMYACNTADLHPTLMGLEHGIDTVVKDGGRSLSGGQRQRVAIARARVRDAPILILDEATSALDQTSKARVMQLIRDWRKGKTTIIITHDVSQILDEDYLYVLDRGRVVQEGYRQKLAKVAHGLFATLISNQDHARSTPDCISPVRYPIPSLPTTLTCTESPSLRVDWAKDMIQRPRSPADLFRLQHSSQVLVADEDRNSPWGEGGTALEVGSNHANIIRRSGIWNTSKIQPESKDKPLQPVHRWSNESCTDDSSPYLPGSSNRHPRSISDQTSHAVREGTCGSNEKPEIVISEESETWNEVNDILNDTGGDHVARGLEPVRLTKVFATIWPSLTWRGRLSFILGFLFAFVVAIATPAFAYILAKLLTVYYAAPQDRSRQATVWATALLGVAILDGFSSYAYHWLLEYCGQAWINSLRIESLKRILAQPKCWFDEEGHSPDRIAECLDRNAEEMRNLIGRFAGPIWVTFWTLGISIVWALIIDWKLSLVALSSAPIMYLGSRLFSYVTTKYEDKCNKAAEYTNGVFTETFSNIRVVRALTLEDYFTKKHTEATNETFKIGMQRGLYSGATFGFADSLSCMISALVFYYGTLSISRGDLTTGAVLQVFNLLLFGMSNALATIALLPQINSSRTTATQMLFLARLPYKTSHEARGTRRIPSPFPIVLNHLNFTYPNRTRPALTDISLTLHPGTCTAIIGASGSGKSTIAALLLGLYPPDPIDPGHPPSLTYAGHPMHTLHTPSLRHFIAIVTQDSHLFPATIYANIIYGLPERSPHATLAAAQRAAVQAGIHDFIASLSHGYETRVGAGGQTLSGGQAQRVAIARALVRRPRLLILDEATSALDAIGAKGVREMVGRLRAAEAGMAVVLITHSVEMMGVAGEVVVVEGGRVVRRGRDGEDERAMGVRREGGGRRRS